LLSLTFLFPMWFVCFLSLVCSPALFALSHFTPSPTPHHHSTTMTTLRSGTSYADVTAPSDSLTDTTDTLTVTTDPSPVRKAKSKKQKRDFLDSASDSDETSSSKFARSRANSEDSQLVDAEVGTSSIPRNRLFVGGIPLQLREHEIDEIFSKFGKVKHVQVLQTKYNTSKVLLNSLLSPTFHRFVLCR